MTETAKNLLRESVDIGKIDSTIAYLDPDRGKVVDTDKALATAALRLGYKFPEEQRANDESQRNSKLRMAKDQKVLGQVLNDLGVKPFTKESVDKYKERATKQFPLNSTIFLLSGVLSLILWGVGKNNPVGIIIFPFVAVASTQILMTLVVLLCAFICIFSPSFEEFFEGRLSPLFYRYSFFFSGEVAGKKIWQKSKIENYKNEIPAGVIARAAQINDALPSTEFFVEDLVLEQRAYDPFLIVKYGSAEYYIFVWNEPKFKAEYC
jgi:hypothetical protein